MNEALGNLEEITVRLIRCEIDSKVLLTISWNFHANRCHIERISNLFACCFVSDVKESPINAHWEGKLIEECQGFRFTLSS